MHVWPPRYCSVLAVLAVKSLSRQSPPIPPLLRRLHRLTATPHFRVRPEISGASSKSLFLGFGARRQMRGIMRRSTATATCQRSMRIPLRPVGGKCSRTGNRGAHLGSHVSPRGTECSAPTMLSELASLFPALGCRWGKRVQRAPLELQPSHPSSHRRATYDAGMRDRVCTAPRLMTTSRSSCPRTVPLRPVGAPHPEVQFSRTAARGEAPPATSRARRLHRESTAPTSLGTASR